MVLLAFSSGPLFFADTRSSSRLLARAEAVERAVLALEHAHELAIDIRVRVIAALPAKHAKRNRHLVAGDGLSVARRQDLDLGAVGRLTPARHRRRRILMRAVRPRGQNRQKAGSAKDE